MSLLNHAKREMKVAGLYDADSDYGGMLAKSVEELVELFAKQGHSGASAARTIQIFTAVAGYKNLTPLTGEDSEWNDTGEVLQNNRVSSVFKEKDTGRSYYLDAIVWRTPTGSTWSGSAGKTTSRQYIKAFPFTPKTFYVDVIEEEVKKDDWLFHVKDPSQLIAVDEYYDMPADSA